MIVSRLETEEKLFFLCNLAYHQLDSAQIAENSALDITWIVQQLPGVTFEKTRMGKVVLNSLDGNYTFW